jgi:hypothetical protein
MINKLKSIFKGGKEKGEKGTDSHINPAGPPFEAYKGNQPYIFISYSHKDSKAVFREIAKLYHSGYRIWYDEGIDPGNEWPDEVADALEKSSFFIVFISPNSIASQNVKNEINFTLNKHKPFLAVYLSDIELPSGLALRMGDIQAIFKHKMDDATFTRKIGRALPEKLIDNRQKKLSTSVIESKPTSQPENPGTKVEPVSPIPIPVTQKPAERKASHATLGSIHFQVLNADDIIQKSNLATLGNITFQTLSSGNNSGKEPSAKLGRIKAEFQN